MSVLPPLLISFYEKLLLVRPRLILFCLLVLVAFLGYKAKDFKLDASTQTLIIETDEDLRYSQEMKSRYGGYDYLLLTFTPKGDLFSDHVLTTLRRLRDELGQLESVSEVVSILDVPLLESPPVPVNQLATSIQTLESPTVDLKRAKIEFADSPLYRDLLVSEDLKTTALQIKFQPDEAYQDLLARHDQLREKRLNGSLAAAEGAGLEKVAADLQSRRDALKETRHRDIAAIRAVMARYRGEGELFLGGISMITDDLISFIKNDLKIFGLGVLLLLIIILGIIFRNKRWVILPILCCASSAIVMMGLLGMFGWRVTVISSNFISLQLIVTMAITIHLIVRYRYLLVNNPAAEQRQLIRDTVRQMMTPCLFTTLTTIAGFGSLLFCNILPVKTFGWMMIAGISVSLILTFLLFPAGLMLLDKKTIRAPRKSRYSLTSFLAGFTEAHGTAILAAGGVIIILSVVGITRLTVENSFIDYFKDTTEIYQGMKVIDQKLGGTTPLDVIIQLGEPGNPKSAAPSKAAEIKADDDADFDKFDEFNEFDKFDEFEEKADADKYWFTSGKMALVTRIHDYLDSLPATGKVLSLATMLKIAEKLNHGKPLDNFQLALLYSELPEKFRDMVLNPYVSIPNNQLRFSIRVKDSEKSLKRDLLLEKIRADLQNRLGLKGPQIHLTGLLVLYNNMLQSLFESQILTLVIVVLALTGMFWILFRSLRVALIALVPNLLAVGAVLGFMGWMNIPLDMMTITIAAISMGIAVDNAIHYIYRFKKEFANKRDYIATLHLCHGSIGKAMYYTSVTIIIGFSILVLSNFLPSIYFGLLTGLAMLIALFASLTLLPQLLVTIRPFGPENGDI
jgi:predicted RND superfamily exporter protein